MRRTDLLDTSESAHRELVRLLRARTVNQRLDMVIDRTEAGQEMHRLALARVSERRHRWESEKPSTKS